MFLAQVRLNDLAGYSFIVRWKDGQHDMRFIATRGRATAVGEHRADIRPWHNGILPDQKTLENVIASALQAVKYEALDRKWDRGKQTTLVSPTIPLLGAKSEGYTSLYVACGDEILPCVEVRANSMRPMSDNHVHIHGDPATLKAFVSLGAKPRLFGNKPMIPGANALKPLLA